MDLATALETTEWKIEDVTPSFIRHRSSFKAVPAYTDPMKKMDHPFAEAAGPLHAGGFA